MILKRKMDRFIFNECREKIKTLNKFKKYIEEKEFINRLGIENFIDDDLKRLKKLKKRVKNRLKN